MQAAMPSRFRYHTPTAELERRWNAVRARMNENEIDCLILNAYDNMLGGYLRYFTDLVISDYPVTAVFHREGDMTVVGHGGAAGRSVSEAIARGFAEAPATPMMPTLYYTDDYVPDIVADSIKKRGHKRIGVVAMATMTASMYKYLTENLPGTELVDATDMVDRIKAIKSPYELERLEEVVKIHDSICAAMPGIYRAGRWEYEMTSDLRKLAGDLGAECVVNVGLGTDAVMPGKVTLPLQHKRAEPGDLLFCLVEISGPGGAYGEILRIWSLGEPPERFVRAGQDAAKCSEELIPMLRPGTKASDLLMRNNEFMTARGYFPEGRLFGHGQGYDMVERPAFVEKETMVLEENMFITMHPGAVSADTLGLSCNSYIITRDGCRKLTKTPDGLIVC